MAELLTGLVLHARSGQHEVQDGPNLVVCHTRGRLKQARLGTDLVATGDRVRYILTAPGRGAIEEVLPRRTQLSRRRPGPGRVPVEQVIVANPDLAVFLFAFREPPPNLRMLDRLLVLAGANELPVLICANKVDLCDDAESLGLFRVYEEIGYEVLHTSAVTGQGIGALRARLQGQICVLSGPSGAGKSTLLNALQPSLGLRTREISESTGKGRHTTVSVRLWPLEGGGYLADTPGLREAGFYLLEPEELAWHFLEFRPYLGDCRFSSCTHTHEPGCAVLAALDKGAIHPARHDSYCRLRESL